jgi:four helix bundle protein
MDKHEPSPSRQRTLALQKRSFDFTCAVVCAYPSGRLDDPSRDIWRQLVKATTSSTFNLEESDAASSDADFLAKMRISTREAKEAKVALRIIAHCKLAAHQKAVQLRDEADQLAAILFTIVKNREENLERGS